MNNMANYKYQNNPVTSFTGFLIHIVKRTNQTIKPERGYL